VSNGGKPLFEVAKELHLSTGALRKLLAELGYEVKGGSRSVVPPEWIEACRKRLDQERYRYKIEERKKRKFHKPRTLLPYEEYKEEPSRDEAEREIRQTWARIESKPFKRHKKRRPEYEKREKEKEQKVIGIPEVISVKELAETLGMNPVDLVAHALREFGLTLTVNQRIDFTTAQILAQDLGYEVKKVSIETELVEEEEPKEVKPRPPVVSVLGHIDHGKTTLLDAIRNTDVAAREYGRITQHIGAYHVKYGKYGITFIDTPGHEAFTAMRARGAQVTDIAILVVAADDGVMPQTIEAIDHIREAGIPMIVAINKIDLPAANVDKVVSQLYANKVDVEPYGGKVPVCYVSAKTRQGIEDLLDTIVLVAEELDLKAPYDVKAKGVILESHIDKGKGKVATVLVFEGILKVGDVFVAGTTWGRVRCLWDEWGNKKEACKPGEPAQVAEFEELPLVGDKFVVVSDERRAREVAQKRKEIEEMSKWQRIRSRISLESIQQRIQEGKVKELKLILKADVTGTLEALADAVSKIDTKKRLEIKIIHKGIGDVNPSDVLLAEASEAPIIGFNVGVMPQAHTLAREKNVEIHTFKVIYDVVKAVEAAIAGILVAEEEEVTLGKARIKAIFNIREVGKVAGVEVLEGKVKRGALVRVMRNGKKVFEGKIVSLKHYKEDKDEISAGNECGIGLGDPKAPIREGDILEVYEKRKVLAA